MQLNLITLVLLTSSIEGFSLFNKLKNTFKRGPDMSKCQIANLYGWAYVSSGKYPPCWVENGGKYDCYDYESSGKCPNWNGMFDRTKQGGGGKKQPPAQKCDRGNLHKICDTAKETCPPCWQKVGNEYDCYDRTSNGQCPWGGMVEIDKL